MLLDSMWVLLTRLVQRGANLLVFMLLARALTPAELGLYGYVVSTALVLSVAFDLGLRQGVAAVVGASPDRAGAAAGQLLLLWCGLGSLASAAAWAMMAWGGLAETGPAAMILAVAAVAPMLLVRMAQGLFLGAGDLKRLNQSELVSRALLLLLTALFWALGGLDLAAALALMALSQLAAAAFVLGCIKGSLGWRHFADRAMAGELLRRGLGFAGAILLMILSGRIGVWLVAWLQPPAEAGSYFAVLRLAEMLVEVATAVGVVVFSHGVRMVDDATAAAATAGVGRTVTACMALAALAAGAFAAPALTLVLGSGYAGDATALRWALGGAVASCLVMILYPGLSSRGRAPVGIWIFGAAVLVNLAAGLALVPAFGAAGAAAAFAAGQWAAGTAVVVAYRRIHGLGFRQLLLPGAMDLRQLLQPLRRRRRVSLAPGG